MIERFKDVKGNSENLYKADKSLKDSTLVYTLSADGILTIYNSWGQCENTYKLNSGVHEYTFDTHKLMNGVYYYKVSGSESAKIGRIIITR